jgi:hypothetical protein
VANTQATFGFKETGYLSGGSPDFQIRPYTIASAYATAIGLGDPVMLTTGGTQTGTVIQATGALATTIPILGIFKGCFYIPTGGQAPTWSPFYPGSGVAQNATAYVMDAPNAQFLVAALNTAISSWYIGWNVNFTTGSPTTTGGGFSVATIDQATATTLGTTASLLPFKILGLYPGVGNGSDPTTAFNWAIVGFNFQLLNSHSHG